MEQLLNCCLFWCKKLQTFKIYLMIKEVSHRYPLHLMVTSRNLEFSSTTQFPFSSEIQAQFSRNGWLSNMFPAVSQKKYPEYYIQFTKHNQSSLTCLLKSMCISLRTKTAAFSPADVRDRSAPDDPQQSSLPDRPELTGTCLPRAMELPVNSQILLLHRLFLSGVALSCGNNSLGGFRWVTLQPRVTDAF